MSKVIRKGIIFWIFAFTIVSLALSHVIYHRKPHCRSSETNIECSDYLIEDCPRFYTYEKIISGQTIFVACEWRQILFILAVTGLSLTEITLILLAFALIGKALPEKMGYITLIAQCILIIAFLLMTSDAYSKRNSVKSEQTFVRATYYIVCVIVFCSNYLACQSAIFEQEVRSEYKWRRERREGAGRNRVVVDQTHQTIELENPQDSSQTLNQTNINVTVNQGYDRDYDPDYDTGEARM